MVKTMITPAILSLFSNIDSEESEQLSFNKKYIKQKLDHRLTRIWMDVQQKVKLFVLGTDLAHFKLEEFIRVLDIIHR
jgi:hypothetical protein